MSDTRCIERSMKPKVTFGYNFGGQSCVKQPVDIYFLLMFYTLRFSM